MNDSDEMGVFLGLDVGKSAHHGHGLTPTGKKVFDKHLPSTEPKLRDVFTKLKTKFGTVLVIVDQPASIGALPLTVARSRSATAGARRSAHCPHSPGSPLLLRPASRIDLFPWLSRSEEVSSPSGGLPTGSDLRK